MLNLTRQGFRVSIRAAVVAGVLIATLLIAAVAIGLQYFFSRSLATDATQAVYQQTVASTRDYLSAADSRANATARILAQFPKLVENDQVSDETRALFAEIMQRNALFYSIYIGFDNGYFYELVNLDTDEAVGDQLRAEPEDRWVIITVSGQGEARERQFEYFDEDFNSRRSWSHQTEYDVTKRPWFINADKNSVHKTDPYLFQHIQAPGQTYSTRIAEDNAVLAVDIALSAVSEYMQSLDVSDGSDMFLYQDTGEIIAGNNPQQPRQQLPPAPELKLSEAQQKIVEDNRYLTVSNEIDWPPVNFAVSGRPYGYAIDTLSYIEEMTGFRLRYINGLNWNDMAAMFLSDELDVIQPVFFNEQRQVVGELSEPFVKLPYGAVTAEGAEPLTSVSDLQDSKVAVHKDWSLKDNLEALYPEIEIIEAESVRDLFTLVKNGNADVALDTAAVLRYTAEEFFIDGVTLHSPLQTDEAALPQQLHFLINRNATGVAEIFDLALAELGDKHKSALANRWLSDSAEVRHIGSVPYQSLLEMTGDGEAESLQTLDIDGEDHFAYVAPLTEGGDEFFAIMTPADTVLAPAMQQVWNSVLITALILLLLLPVTALFASPVVDSIRRLVDDSEKIKQRRFSEVMPARTYITEINNLSDSMQDMSHSIESYAQQQQDLMEAFIELIAQAIDDKSPYTAGHCARVPELAFMLAEEAENSQTPPFREFGFKNQQEWREFKIGAWLHDCGKITTPEHIIDKGTKLETIYNRIHEIRMRFEVLWRDAEIDYRDKLHNNPQDAEKLRRDLATQQARLKADFAFIAECNVGSESMDEAAIERLEQLADITWQRYFDDRLGLSPIEEDHFAEAPRPLPATEKLLADRPEHIIERYHSTDYDPRLGIKMTVPEHLYNLGELYNLKIKRGTLTPEDRFKINEHIISTIRMLDNLPFPPELSQVPRYASTHHETLIGTGYPRKLTAEDLSLPERIMILADIFEALTAADRPYKKAKPVSVAIDILYKMVQNQHIDPDVFELFLRSGVYIQYARRFLPESQIDEVDISQYLSD